MRKFFGLLVILVFWFSHLSAQNKLNHSDWKMTQAKMMTEDNRFKDAIQIYSELYKDFSEDAFLNYRLALCNFSIKNFLEALNFIKIAIKNCDENSLLNDFYFLSSKIHHRLNQFSEAKTMISKISLDDDSDLFAEINFILKQIDNAIKLSKTPLDLEPKNCGPLINSEFNEFYPVFSAQLNKIYFTSDRNYKQGQEINEITKFYNYSVFESLLNEKKEFAKPQLVDEIWAEGKNFILNSVSAGDQVYYLYKNTPALKDNGNIYTDTQDTEDDFTDAVLIDGDSLNTRFYEASASYDYLNDKLYLVSNRKDRNKQNSSVFMSKMSKNKYSEPKIVNALSSDFNDNFIYVHPNQTFAVIASDNDKSMGGFDLFISINIKGKWSEPENMAYPFNSSGNETQFTLSNDGKTAYIASDRAGGYGGYDIYEVDFEKYITEKLSYLPALTYYKIGVFNDEAEEITEAIVKIKSKTKPKLNIKTQTNLEGYCYFNLTDNSDYIIEITAKNYQKLSVELSPDTSGYVEKDFELIKK
ncbi:MAG: hypothetical protein GX793_03130 [Bacteroidales bacterium]|nr:hypothetical protein [Bacteroidales bacterium]